MNWNSIYIDLVTNADNGDDKSINQFHNYYSLEKYQLQDFNEELINFYVTRADDNKPYSLAQLAMMYLSGLGVPVDTDKGIDLLKKSIALECSHGYYLMGLIVLINNFDYEMTYEELMDKAMSLNNSTAYVQKAIDCTDNNFKKSRSFYKKAIELENDYAIFKLGELYHDHQKYKLAIKYYNQAIDKNISHAYFNLAVMYREGEGVDVDLDNAKILFKQSMNLDNIRAITCLGDLSSKNDNATKAKKYYKLATSKGDQLAGYHLGTIYESEKKYKKAIKCFIVSAVGENPISQRKLVYDYNVTKLEMTDDEIDELLNFHYTFRNFGAYDGFLSR